MENRARTLVFPCRLSGLDVRVKVLLSPHQRHTWGLDTWGTAITLFFLFFFFLFFGGGDTFFSFLKETIANWVWVKKVKGNSFQGKLSKDPDVYVFILIKINMHNILCLHVLILTLSSLFSLEVKKMDLKCYFKVLNVIEKGLYKSETVFLNGLWWGKSIPGID